MAGDERQFIWWEIPEDNIAKLEEVLKPVHEEAATMSEEEINAVIDDAIAEVRKERGTMRGNRDAAN